MDAKSNVGEQDFTFVGAAASPPTAGELRYEDGLISGYVNYDTNPDFQVRIANNYALSAEDFIL
jgi:serralysin